MQTTYQLRTYPKSSFPRPDLFTCRTSLILCQRSHRAYPLPDVGHPAPSLRVSPPGIVVVSAKPGRAAGRLRLWVAGSPATPPRVCPHGIAAASAGLGGFGRKHLLPVKPLS